MNSRGYGAPASRRHASKMLALRGLGALIACGLFVGCLSPGKSAPTNPQPVPEVAKPAPAAAAQAVVVKVAIADFMFTPATVSVPVGGTVQWTNNDPHGHTATQDDPNGWGSPLLNQGDSWSQTFPTPGTYSYHCETHPWMKGTVVVTAR